MCVSKRTEVCKIIHVEVSEGKQLLITALYGGALPQHFHGQDFMQKVQKMSQYLL